MSALHGILPVDKPPGPSSHDIVAIARRALRERRIGHTGTLDPFASGLLLLCIGAATRLAEYLSALPKRYTATLRLGIVTETDDDRGRVLRATEDLSGVTRPALEAALAAQTGLIHQVPPRYSAKKVRGERMYALARRGADVTPEPVAVTVFRIQLLRFEPPEAVFEVDCSSGTYIRAIARDVGAQLGVGGHLVALRRTRIGHHRVAAALAPEALEDAESVRSALITGADALAHLPRFVLAEAELAAIAHGHAIPAPAGAAPTGPLALLAPDGRLVAVAEAHGDRLQPRKVFA
jgi:tRNA pseudouridine55 synthase